MMYLFIFLLLLPLSLLANPESSARRIQAHLLIGDAQAAVSEGRHALKIFPEEPLIYEWLIRSLSASGEDVEMMQVWGEFHAHFEERALEQEILEEMCWGILKKGQRATGLSSQLICLIGAALTHDMHAVPFLLHGMHHSNADIRGIAVELASVYGDHPLREQISSLFRTEKVLEMRLKVIKALGKLQIETHLPDLIQCVANPKTGPKEKLAAIEAIIHIRDRVDADELRVLASSDRSGLRQLACEVIAHCDLKESADLLIPLINDPHPEVCAAALKTWGIFKKEVTEGIKQLALKGLDPTVGVTAAWVWLIRDPVEGEQGMIRWLEHENAHVRALAASAVAAAGPYGVTLAKKILATSKDPYVQANLAIALAGQRESSEEVCEVLENCLQNQHERWMFSENGLFKTLEKSDLSHNPSISNFPEVVNQTVRLEVLNLLAILESPRALDALKVFLKERKWGVTGLAAETLLGEGDETAIDLVRAALEDADPEVRTEAALVLASWGKDHSALPILLEAYPKGDRQLQLKILESLGRLGEKKAIPFLIERLKEPSLIVRMVAASVLIQTLNH